MKKSGHLHVKRICEIKPYTYAVCILMVRRGRTVGMTGHYFWCRAPTGRAGLFGDTKLPLVRPGGIVKLIHDRVAVARPAPFCISQTRNYRRLGGGDDGAVPLFLARHDGCVDAERGHYSTSLHAQSSVRGGNLGSSHFGN